MLAVGSFNRRHSVQAFRSFASLHSLHYPYTTLCLLSFTNFSTAQQKWLIRSIPQTSLYFISHRVCFYPPPTLHVLQHLQICIPIPSRQKQPSDATFHPPQLLHFAQSPPLFFPARNQHRAIYFPLRYCSPRLNCAAHEHSVSKVSFPFPN